MLHIRPVCLYMVCCMVAFFSLSFSFILSVYHSVRSRMCECTSVVRTCGRVCVHLFRSDSRSRNQKERKSRIKMKQAITIIADNRVLFHWYPEKCQIHLQQIERWKHKKKSPSRTKWWFFIEFPYFMIKSTESIDNNNVTSFMWYDYICTKLQANKVNWDQSKEQAVPVCLPTPSTDWMLLLLLLLLLAML